MITYSRVSQTLQGFCSFSKNERITLPLVTSGILISLISFQNSSAFCWMTSDGDNVSVGDVPFRGVRFTGAGPALLRTAPFEAGSVRYGGGGVPAVREEEQAEPMLYLSLKLLKNKRGKKFY